MSTFFFCWVYVAIRIQEAFKQLKTCEVTFKTNRTAEYLFWYFRQAPQNRQCPCRSHAREGGLTSTTTDMQPLFRAGFSSCLSERHLNFFQDSIGLQPLPVVTVVREIKKSYTPESKVVWKTTKRRWICDCQFAQFFIKLESVYHLKDQFLSYAWRFDFQTLNLRNRESWVIYSHISTSKHSLCVYTDALYTHWASNETCHHISWLTDNNLKGKC